MGFRCFRVFTLTNNAVWRLARVFWVHSWQRKGCGVCVSSPCQTLLSTVTEPLTLSPGEDQSFLCSTSSQILGITKVLSLANLMGMKERPVVSICMWHSRAGLLSVTTSHFHHTLLSLPKVTDSKDHIQADWAQAPSAAQYLPQLWRFQE